MKVTPIWSWAASTVGEYVRFAGHGRVSDQPSELTSLLADTDVKHCSLLDAKLLSTIRYRTPALALVTWARCFNRVLACKGGSLVKIAYLGLELWDVRWPRTW